MFPNKRDKNINEILAIKILRPDLASDQTAAKRFEQEAKTAIDLTHPNIGAVFDYGKTPNGAPYLVMNFFDGETLEQILDRDAPLNQKRALNIFIEITEALAHAHMKGVVHRDLKPANIIITKSETGAEVVHLVDFGIAKVQEGDVRATHNLTKTDDVLGSPLYMSPEQCLGLGLDSQSDIYSLGCILFEAFTGEKAFSGENAIQVIAQHLNGGALERLLNRLKRHKVPQDIPSA
jgi:serine/threonine-protein kinase